MYLWNFIKKCMCYGKIGESFLVYTIENSKFPDLKNKIKLTEQNAHLLEKSWVKIERSGEKRISQTGLLFSDHTFLNDCFIFSKQNFEWVIIYKSIGRWNVCSRINGFLCCLQWIRNNSPSPWLEQLTGSSLLDKWKSYGGTGQWGTHTSL